jgi:cytosine/adenosine deaminase-related metal-dependent hydrolase
LGPYGPAALASFAATPGDSPWIIHLAEGTDRASSEELDQLERLGCLAANTVLVHAVGLGAGDVAKVIERGAAVVWCPASNLALLNATLDPRPFFEAGRLAIGSDSRLSGSRDLLAELRVASSHCSLNPADIVQIATVGGSHVLGLPDVGGLAPGQRADLVVVRDTGGDPHRALLALERGDLRAVVLGGAPAIADGDFAEWCDACEVATVPVSLDGRPKILARSRAAADAIALEPGLQLRV